MDSKRREHIICPVCHKFFDYTKAEPLPDKMGSLEFYYCPHCNSTIHVPQAFAVGDFMNDVEEELGKGRADLYAECIKYIHHWD